GNATWRWRCFGERWVRFDDGGLAWRNILERHDWNVVIRRPSPCECDRNGGIVPKLVERSGQRFFLKVSCTQRSVARYASGFRISGPSGGKSGIGRPTSRSLKACGKPRGASTATTQRNSDRTVAGASGHARWISFSRPHGLSNSARRNVVALPSHRGPSV